MEKDIENRQDIENLIDAFYRKVVVDETIGYFFTEVVQLSWEKHIPIMYSFWETILLDNITYKGNPMVKHIELNRLEALTKEHFTRWLFLWKETIDEYFKGSIANIAKSKADQMAALMMYKIEQSGNKNFIQ